MKKLLALLLAITMLTGVLSACGSKSDDKDKSESSSSDKKETVADPVDTLKAQPSTDKYRAYYQVWIGSFCDSDDDQIGDLPGLISKLDYINDGDPDAGDDLGAEGIWLSPMMPSSTYHKYNVENYYEIDPDFGTMDDFDKLLEESHKRGISVIIDLVVNHAGAGHEFFQKACDEIREGKTDGYARYFNFSKKQDDVYQYNVSGTDYYYQADFWDQMPDWNLSYDGTREYFEDVAKFWLEKGVDGFRLDAVKYFEDEHTDGKEFLKWFYETAQKYNPDVYMVGEDWDDAAAIYKMYDTGIDSLFNFKFAQSNGDYLMSTYSKVDSFAKSLKKYNDKIKEHNKNAINANFVTNHDMPRLAYYVDEGDNKMVAALYMLSPGNSYTYYGEEIGIECDNTSTDANYRTGMVWDNDDLMDIKVDGTKHTEENELGGVKQQLEDKNSLLNTYRKLFKIRMQNPEIARGDITEVVEFDDSNCAGYIVDYNGSRVLIIHNVSEDDKTVTVDMIDNPELRAWSTAGDDVENYVASLDGDSLEIPARTSVVLKENK